MGNNKKYFWLKLDKDFFKRRDIEIIESMDNGKDYLLFYLKLLCEGTATEGNLRFNEAIPYDAKMLATITNTNIDVVRSAIKIFTELGMMEILDNQTIFMTEVIKITGTESSSAERVRKHREKQKSLKNDQKALHCNSDVTNSNTEIEIELDIEKEKDIVDLPVNHTTETDAELQDYIQKAVMHLRITANRQFQASNENTIKKLGKLYHKKVKLEDIYTVINYKIAEWGNDEKMSKYLRPATLFSNKFFNYLEEANQQVIVANDVPEWIDKELEEAEEIDSDQFEDFKNLSEV